MEISLAFKSTTSLKGGPVKVEGNYDAYFNKLTISLDGSP
jgi:hypothetical protein